MRMDVEREFANCVRGMGAVVLDDLAASSAGARPSAADYWFPDHCVVAELKCLTVDTIAGQPFKQKANELYSRWIAEGLVPRPAQGVTRYNIRDLPPQCAKEMLSHLKRGFERNVLRTANAQIKSTKMVLNRPNAKGLLIIANDGNLSFTPHVVIGLLNRSLGRQFSSIHSVIYFSANVHASLGPPDNPVGPFWIDGVIPDRQAAPAALRDALQASWIRHVERQIRASVRVIDRSDISESEFVAGKLFPHSPE
jgi:hypothetical protein